MDKKLFILIIIGICVLVIISIFMSSFSKSPSSSQQAIASPSPITHGSNNTATVNQNTAPTIFPETVVKNFYSWYMSNSENPLTTGAYKKSQFLTTSYKKTIDEFLAGNPPPGSDPVFCSANKTKNPAVESALYNDTGNQATVVIHDGDIDGGKSLYRVILKHNGDKWLIDDIMCLP